MVELMGMLIGIYIIVFGMVILKNYMEFNDSNYQKASHHTFWQTFFNKGNMGEYNIYRTLEKIKGTKLILTNLYIPKEDGSTTEIDLVIITNFGFFVIESKNYSGWIFGDEKYRNWTQTFPNKKKFKFFNPIWQNKGHVKALKEVLDITDESLMQSYIVFSNNCELKKITVTSPNVSVMKRNQMRNSLKRDLRNSAPKLTSEDIKAYFQVLKPFMHADEETKQLHIKKIQEKLGQSKS
ncbi:MAG: nuclease-related domain-containing protein [Carnobacterium sp.]|uniref:nuclease-related domain-containing protein n=1 Tax=Carnobacterium sp. TaxID=48221 RepID=UPI003314BABE